jgi:hypothetical protein
MKIAYLTVCSNSYLGQAMTLAESLASSVPGATLLAYLTDEPEPAVSPSNSFICLVPMEEYATPDIREMAERYDTFQFSTAMKPYCMLHALEKRGFDAVVYLDSDTMVTAPLVHVTDALERGVSCVMTPHITEPVKDGTYPDEDSYLNCGVFNTGFAAFSKSPEALRFLRWWAGKTQFGCITATNLGIFVDQAYCNMAPCFFDNMLVLRNKGYNLAYWNLMHRPISKLGDTYSVENELVRFVHFSGFVTGRRDIVSKYQVRYDSANCGLFVELLDRYHDMFERNDKTDGLPGNKIPSGVSREELGKPTEGKRVLSALCDRLSSARKKKMQKLARWLTRASQ